MKHRLISSIILLFSATSLFACDCEPWYETVEDWFVNAPIAIEGEIISSEYIGRDDTVGTVNEDGDSLIKIHIDPNAYGLFKVRVKMNFKNEVMDSIITVKSESNSDCSAYFNSNQTYIIFASRTEEGSYSNDVCYGSRLSNEDDIEVLKRIKN